MMGLSLFQDKVYGYFYNISMNPPAPLFTLPAPVFWTHEFLPGKNMTGGKLRTQAA